MLGSIPLASKADRTLVPPWLAARTMMSLKARLAAAKAKRARETESPRFGNWGRLPDQAG